MNANEAFEIVNDFIANKDGTQLNALVNDLEVFSSKALNSGHVVIGEKAPDAFRNAIVAYEKSKKKVDLNLVDKIGNDLGCIFIVHFGKPSKETLITIICLLYTSPSPRDRG